jgi:hypothetical protein
MPATNIRGSQILNSTIQRQDLDTATTGQAVVAKLVQGTNVVLSSTGVDSGTGDVTISVPTGGQGPAGTPGTKWWNGVGAPGTIPGSNPGDYYLDTSNGNVYVL